MKRFFSVLFSVVATICLATHLTIPSLAASVQNLSSDVPNEMGPFSSFSSYDHSSTGYGVDEILTEGVLDDEVIDTVYIADIIEDNFNNDPSNFSDEAISHAKDIIEEVESIQTLVSDNATASINSTTSTYASNKAKLREGNYIELVLDIDEGLGSKAAAGCITLAAVAKTDIAASYTATQYTDPGQHFIWAFLMTNSYSKSKARTVGNNHEWGITMISYMETYYTNRYNTYLSNGIQSSSAADKALTDTVNYIPSFKQATVNLCASSQSYFSAFFSKDSVMDFWNNCYGRSYVAKGYSSAINAFNASVVAGEVILGSYTSDFTANVTSDHIYCVWSWDWYSY